MEIKPFCAYRFDGSVTGNAGQCIAPPYDVIDPKLQQALYDANPYNIVRAILGKTAPSDTQTDNQYTRAREYLDKATADGALKQDPQKAVYAYVQDFAIGTKSYRRSGIIALGKIEPFGKGVQPHEKTLDGPKADRLRLTRATASQFGQIFMLYDDPQKTAEAIIKKASTSHPVLDHTDNENVRHRVYMIVQQDMIKAFADMIQTRKTIIADGHHRYETALNYWKQTGHSDAQYLMMTFVNMHNEGLVIQPTHRLINDVKNFSIDKLMSELTSEFDPIVKFDFTDEKSKTKARQAMFDLMNQAVKNGKNAFGIYAANGAFYTVTLNDMAAMKKVAPAMSDAARGLDVNVLHLLILEKHLGIGDKQLAEESNIEYIKDIGDAIDQSIHKVDSGHCQAVFFVNPTRIDQVQAVAAAGEKMPQKSTFFYPKVFSGVTINKLPIAPMEPYNNRPLTQCIGKE
ncbi:MAG: DUF1015 domain-containing protein [Anaerohalosphaeraceae bacterium]